jgi:hypothetical protein
MLANFISAGSDMVGLSIVLMYVCQLDVFTIGKVLCIVHLSNGVYVSNGVDISNGVQTDIPKENFPIK